MLPRITGEFGIVSEPQLQFSQKGKAYAKVRGVAKKRTKDNSGQWKDGTPLYMDIVCFDNYATNMIESVTKGDTIFIDGELEYKEWTDEEGNTKGKYQIVANHVAASFRWATAKSHRILETNIQHVAESLNADIISEEAPF